MTQVKGYFFATRPWSFSCCAQPAFLGNLLAYYLLADVAGFTFNRLTLVLTLVGMVAAPAGCNMVNDYFDCRLGCDPTDNTGARDWAVDGAIAVYYLVVVGGWVLWVMVAAAAFMLFFYTAPPISLK